MGQLSIPVRGGETEMRRERVKRGLLRGRRRDGLFATAVSRLANLTLRKLAIGVFEALRGTEPNGLRFRMCPSMEVVKSTSYGAFDGFQRDRRNFGAGKQAPAA
jgi:hypothetical protein